MKREDNRLRRKKDFEITFAHGRTVAGEFMLLKYCPIDIEKYPKRGLDKNDLKIAFVVSTKISKKAVVRNRIRRIMRESFRLLMKQKEIKLGYYLVFIAKPTIEQAKIKAVINDTEKVLKVAKLI